MMRVFLLLIVLAGCVQQFRWHGGSGDLAQFKRDNWECTRDSGTFGGGSGLPGALMIIEARRQSERLYQQCMESKGYVRVQP